MDDVTTSKTPLVETLRALDTEWQSDNWPHDDEPRPRSYYAVAADRIAELEAALRLVDDDIRHHLRDSYGVDPVPPALIRSAAVQAVHRALNPKPTAEE